MTAKTKLRLEHKTVAEIYAQWLHAMAKEVARMLRNYSRSIGDCRYALDDARHACGAIGWDDYTDDFKRPLFEAELIEIDGQLCVMGLEYRKARLVPVRAPLAAPPAAA